MTDEEILKRLAEIHFGKGSFGADVIAQNPSHPWNPLTNWSDLGPLIEKYQIGTVKMGNKNWSAAVWQESIVVEHYIHESLPHAICLAIIESLRYGGTEERRRD